MYLRDFYFYFYLREPEGIPYVGHWTDWKISSYDLHMYLITDRELKMPEKPGLPFMPTPVLANRTNYNTIYDKFHTVFSILVLF